MTLEATIATRVGDFELDVHLVFEPGEVVAVLGPNGSGKSTLLRCLAGLHPIERGRIVLDHLVLDDPAAPVFVPPEQRPIGVVFQDYLLFDHMRVIDNVAFGLRARGTARSTARDVAGTLLEQVGLSERSRAFPRELSGGQAQRVALARALATRPRILLLDEPLAALDAGARLDVRRTLHRHLDTFDGVRILVTHDPVDAYALADRVVILEAGRVVQQGTISQVAAHPRSGYVADLVGTNLLTGTIADGVLRTETGGRIVVADAADGPAFALIRPQSVTLTLAIDSLSSARNSWAGTIADIDRIGDRARVTIDGIIPLTAEVTAAALVALDLRPGATVHASVKATDVVTYPQ